MVITSEMLAIARRKFKEIKKYNLPAGKLRRFLFDTLLNHGFRDWYNHPKYKDLEYTILWLNACTYDRIHHTTMGQANKWNEIDHPSSIMGELHVGMVFNVPDKELMLWQESVAVYGPNGGNAGRDWPKAWTGLNIDLEVKTQPTQKPLYINVNRVYHSRYVIVRGRVPIFNFKIVGTYTFGGIMLKPEVMVSDDLCYKIILNK